jgi:hypothetical protein
MTDAADKPISSSGLELINKEIAKSQARQINKELTKLKRISNRPLGEREKAPVEVDKTGSFVVVPVTALVTEEIDAAHAEAQKQCASEPAPAAKKKWLKWK